MRFPPSFIDRLRSHFPLSEVIGRRVAIKKHGREFQGLCPFHGEKTPSFTVNDDKGFYHCFGCGAHGDALGFIMQYERLTYPEAVERLARDAGIPLPQLTPEAVQKAEEEKTLHGVCEAACRWFEKQLSASAPARGYAQRRGLKAETLARFRIGYAPEDRQALYRHLIGLGFKQPLIAEAGLVVVSEHGAPYDRFRGRLIFPIRNAGGKVVAFGGRLIAPDPSGKLPKYLNSPETPLFKKGELLFNLDLAKSPARAREMAVVMEGYMDVVMSAQAGIDYALATLGTAVSSEHLRLLWQLAKEPILCLDGDAAGKRAMLRALEAALPQLTPGRSLRFAVLPAGEDPDSYVQKHGRQALEAILAQSRRLSQVMWDTLSGRHRLDLPEGRAALEAAWRKLAGNIQDATMRGHYLAYFRKQLWEKKTPASKAPEARSVQIEHMAAQHHSAALEELARRMLSTLARFPSLLHKSQVEEALSDLAIENPMLDAVRGRLLGALQEGKAQDRETLLAHLAAELSDDALKLVAAASPAALPWRDSLSENDAMALWSEALSAYQITQLEIELKELEIAFAQTMDEATYRRLVETKHAIHKAQAARNFAASETS